MPLESDISINVAKFDPANIPTSEAALNAKLLEMGKADVDWWEVGAPKYRELRLAGKTPVPAPTYLPSAQDTSISSRESGRDIPCRLMLPSSSSDTAAPPKCRGAIMHIHGGGWVLQSEKTTDGMLKFLADAARCAVVSVGFRRAPEDPYPLGLEDCEDVLGWLVRHSEGEYGGPVRFVTGESAGAHLSVLTIYHFLRAFPSLPAPALILHFGIYDLTFLPRMTSFASPPPGASSSPTTQFPILDTNKMAHFVSAFLPPASYPFETLKSPTLSPFYANLEEFRGRLPRALFTCGTIDPLLDDSLMMGVKWLVAGGDAVIKVYEGARHMFVLGSGEMAERAKTDVKTFVGDCLDGK